VIRRTCLTSSTWEQDAGTAESYSFAVASQALQEPFSLTQFGTGSVTVLQSATVTGLSVSHQFQYNTSGEMTQVTTPLGGVLQWQYRTFAYTGRSDREVQTRSMKPTSGGTQYTWSVTLDGNTARHGSATVSDAGTNTQKAWTLDIRRGASICTWPMPTSGTMRAG